MYRVFGISAVLAFAAGAGGCKTPAFLTAKSSSVPPPLSAEAAGISESEIASGRSLYIRKCANCHRFYNPKDYSVVEWSSWMNKMSRKSRLTAREEEVLSHYLQGFRSSDVSRKSGFPIQ